MDEEKLVPGTDVPLDSMDAEELGDELDDLEMDDEPVDPAGEEMP